MSGSSNFRFSLSQFVELARFVLRFVRWRTNGCRVVSRIRAHTATALFSRTGRTHRGRRVATIWRRHIAGDNGKDGQHGASSNRRRVQTAGHLAAAPYAPTYGQSGNLGVADQGDRPRQIIRTPICPLLPVMSADTAAPPNAPPGADSRKPPY